MNVTFLIWYNNSTPEIVDVLNSILPSAGLTKISIVAVKTSVGHQLEDSAVRWMPNCRVLYAPGSKKKKALEIGLNNIMNSPDVNDVDFVAVCDPTFIANTKIFNEFYNQHSYRMYIPYSDQYEEKEAGKTDKLVMENNGGNMIIFNRHACYNFKTLPAFLDQYYIDYYIIDQLGMFGYTCHKLQGCYTSLIKKDLDQKDKKTRADDLSFYDAWLKSKQRGGYDKIIRDKGDAVVRNDHLWEENDFD